MIIETGCAPSPNRQTRKAVSAVIPNLIML